MTDGAKLCVALLVASAATTLGACGRPDGQIVAVYERPSGRLVRLDADRNSDGRIDQRTYMDGRVALRAEVDVTHDGRVDRWEYLDTRGQLRLLGTSSGDDGIEDVWTHPIDADGRRLVEHARSRNRHIDRRDYYANDRLVRAEEDNNGDGRVDRWEVYSPDGRVRAVEFDTTLERGWPDRRLTYLADGRYADLEADDDGDGTFVSVASQRSPSEERREQN